MGYATPQVGYNGYIESNDILIEDATEYSSLGGAGYTTKITGSILTDVSKVSKLRFKISLKHSVATSGITARVYIGGRLIWVQAHNNPGHTNYTTYTADRPVTWRRGDQIQVEAQALANTGYNKDFQICGKVSLVRLD